MKLPEAVKVQVGEDLDTEHSEWKLAKSKDRDNEGVLQVQGDTS